MTGPYTQPDVISQGPLAGLNVVEMASVVMGPYAAEILGDLGARVIKVEQPGGELARHYSGGRHPGMSPMFLNSNKNKDSIVINLKDPADCGKFFDLLGKADVFITNQRPQALVKLGVDYESVKDRFPNLVYCGAQGFRRGSAEYEEAAYDEIIQSAAGLTSAMEYLTGSPSCVPSIIADKISSLVIVGSVLAAVHARGRTGRGQEVNIPMADTLFAFTMLEHLNGNTFVPPTGPGGYRISFNVKHGDVQAKDGKIAIHPYSPKNVRDFLAAAGRLDILENDPYFQDWGNTSADGRKHVYDVVAEVAPLLTVAEWTAVCKEHSIPTAIPVDVKDPLSNPYVKEGDLLRQVTHSTEGEILVPEYPVYFSDTPVAPYREAPPLDNLAKRGGE